MTEPRLDVYDPQASNKSESLLGISFLPVVTGGTHCKEMLILAAAPEQMQFPLSM